jgi:two-component system C4-dicarboxylate transport sensor histidine kinase DctB
MKHFPFKITFALPVLSLLLLAGLWHLTTSWMVKHALARLATDAKLIARQQSRLIDSELAKYRLLPVALGEYTDLQDALASGSIADASRLNGKLAFLAAQTGAPVIYILDGNGRVISASNADTPESFVGRNYGFRPYFTQALSTGSGEYYAVGDLSGRPGFFFSRRVGDPPGALGVVVIKYEFQTLLHSWAEDSGQTFVIDPRGIVLASTDSQEEMRSFRPLSAADRAQLTENGQFNYAPLEPSRHRFLANGMMQGPAGELLLPVDEPIPETTLRLIHVVDTAPALREARNLAWLISIATTIVLVALAAIIYWRMTRAARIAADRAALEAAVETRTAELSTEMAERSRADRRFRQAREELAQANRLASLGSITAGLAHEINQPVATIRTLAENAQHHLANADTDRVAANLITTVELTSRIGAITQEMRRFARRGNGETTRMSLDEVIEGTLLLIGDRFRNAAVRLDLPGRGQPEVIANRVQLEQVFVNLFQNALDAVTGRPCPHVVLSVDHNDTWIILVVADNGPGIDAELGEEIFSPFVTSKPDGLGLGLGIARDIIVDMGGTLKIISSPLGGAAFAVGVRRA